MMPRAGDPLGFDRRFRTLRVGLLALLLCWVIPSAARCDEAVFRAGAAAVDITPKTFPVRVNGGFLEKTASAANDALHARALALDDGRSRLVLCVVDTCMMPRELIDRAKQLASASTGLPIECILVSATHTHSAPAAMSCLGSRADPSYVEFLPGQIADAIAAAVKHLEPAQVGWSSIDDWDHTFNRRWIRRHDKLIVDPFGQATGRAHMHPGHQNPDAIGPSGPVDPELSVLAVRSTSGRPIALLANYSQHYFGAPAVSADYYGRFAEHIARLVAETAGASAGDEASAADRPFVGIMSQGTSGDLMWMDYAAPRRTITYDDYAKEVAERTIEAYRRIEWQTHAPLASAQTELALNYRVPDEQRLAWARDKAAAIEEGGAAKSQVEVYALEALHLHERQRTKLLLQALRIGDLGITALPNEVYAITGLKLKAQSPLAATFNIELANGAEGYIPPPEQHALGGYTTWPARTAGLEAQAEPRIVDAALKLLETASGKPRRAIRASHGPYARAVLAAKPAAYWRLEEMAGRIAHDASEQGNDATWDDGFALYLPGAGSGAGISPNAALTTSAFSGRQTINRAVHLASGRLKTGIRLGDTFSVEFWLWNGLPTSLRPTTGVLLATHNGGQLGITGGNGHPGRLYFAGDAPDSKPLIGGAELRLKHWHYVVLVCDGERVSVFFDGAPQPAIASETALLAATADGLVFGGEAPDDAFEGRLDEIAVYDRALAPAEIAEHWKIAGAAIEHAGEKPAGDVDTARPAAGAAAAATQPSAASATAAAAQSVPLADRANIVVIMADDMGFSDLGCYGGEIETPNLDRLASEGMRFSQFYNCALCGPSRAALMTGLHPHQVGIFNWTGLLNDRCVTVFELLKRAGYTTAAVGRLDMATADNWHDPAMLARYVDRFLGSTGHLGPGNYFADVHNTQFYRDGQPFALPEGAYKTDVIADYAVRVIADAAKLDKPFFLYVAQYAPHWPLHAKPAEIAKYRERYRQRGWDAARAERHQRLIAGGLIHDSCRLSPRDARVPPWLDAPDKDWEAERMAVFAAQVDSLDQSVGRIIDALRKANVDRNTLVLFLSDNGASDQAASGSRDKPGQTWRSDGVPTRFGNTPDIWPGPGDTFVTGGPAWANVSNTPFRRHKQSNHEGGIASPLIAWWPGVIEASRDVSPELSHITDITATCLDVAHADYPTRFNGRDVLPLAGKSLAPIFRGQQRAGHESLCWATTGSRAVRVGKWKLVAPKDGAWELYDIDADRTELNDLASQQPERVRAMAKIFDAWRN